jgi:hypothetical protein
MKAYIFLAALLAALPVSGQQPSSALVGHVLSAETHRAHISTSYGVGSSMQRDTEIQVENLVYESSEIHKEILVGKDYPVSIETDKHGAAKKLDFIVGGKKYTYRITGTREAK